MGCCVNPRCSLGKGPFQTVIIVRISHPWDYSIVINGRIFHGEADSEWGTEVVGARNRRPSYLVWNSTDLSASYGHRIDIS